MTDGLFDRVKRMWLKVNVGGSETLGNGLDEQFERGLDIDAETMHQRFLADLPHLDSAKSNHNDLLTHISGRIGESKSHARSFDSPSIGFDVLDKEAVQSGFDIILDIDALTGLSVTTSIEQERRLIRVIAPERFGGMIHTLSIPAYLDIESASLTDGVLHLSFD